jgi:hypothetical protein
VPSLTLAAVKEPPVMLMVPVVEEPLAAPPVRMLLKVTLAELEMLRVLVSQGMVPAKVVVPPEKL